MEGCKTELAAMVLLISGKIEDRRKPKLCSLNKLLPSPSSISSGSKWKVGTDPGTLQGDKQIPIVPEENKDKRTNKNMNKRKCTLFCFQWIHIKDVH